MFTWFGCIVSCENLHACREPHAGLQKISSRTGNPWQAVRTGHFGVWSKDSKLLQAQRRLARGLELRVVESLDLPLGVEEHDNNNTNHSHNNHNNNKSNYDINNNNNNNTNNIIRILSVLTLVSLCADGGLGAPHARRKARQPHGECHASTAAH
ncbi:unnamed protein product [Polarella glacialis]|uniref:Uncharacterized protein n=1 Tax=Polarella glacialis TaxID=89957 RepID=A0A813KNT6_POLGL|nr:unnamed protein product [Polarella glacialis]